MELAAAESQDMSVEQDEDDADYYRDEVGEEPEQGKDFNVFFL